MDEEEIYRAVRDVRGVGHEIACRLVPVIKAMIDGEYNMWHMYPKWERS